MLPVSGTFLNDLGRAEILKGLRVSFDGNTEIGCLAFDSDDIDLVI
jgi:hypothetical protein